MSLATICVLWNEACIFHSVWCNLHVRACTPAFPTGLSLEEVRDYEEKMQEKTNSKVKSTQTDAGKTAAPDPHCTEILQRIGGEIAQLHGWAVQAKVERGGRGEGCGGNEA